MCDVPYDDAIGCKGVGYLLHVFKGVIGDWSFDQ